MESWGAYLGTALLILGAVLFLWTKKRKFDRTNFAGIERFPSFGRKVGALLLDYFLLSIALTCSLSGLLILALKFQDSWGWILLLPLSAWALFMLFLMS